MQKKRTFAIITLITIICLSSCAERPEKADSAALTVAVTTDALYEMATYIGGARVSVTKLIPDGVELHDYEPSTKDIVALGTADLLIINGLGLEPWISSAINAAGEGNLAVIEASDGVTPIAATEHGEDDPHIWLSPSCAAIMAENIRDALISIDPGGETEYKQSCADFTAQLDTQISKYTEILADAENRTIVTGHAVFAYLCRDLDLVQSSVEGVFSEGEPSPQRLAELVDFCRDNGITTVFAESLSSTLVIETLARETGAVIEIIYTIEGAEDGLTYFERMEHNLTVIAGAVQ